MKLKGLVLHFSLIIIMMIIIIIIIIILLLLLMMPKCSPVRCTVLALEQPLPERDNNTKTPSRGTGVEPAKHPQKVKSENAFTTLEC